MANILIIDGRYHSQAQQDDPGPPSIIIDEPAAETWETPPRAEPGPRRWAITFAVIAVLLIGSSLLVLWGFIQSDWLYGTYGEISPAQWKQISDLREQLLQLGIAPELCCAEAVSALNDALLLPRPSTQEALFDLRKAARALDGHAAAQQIQFELYALIGDIEGASEPVYGVPTSTPWATVTPFATLTPTPIVGAPVAQPAP